MNGFLSQILAMTSRPAARAVRRKPQSPPIGADWLALAKSPPDRTRTVYDPTATALVLKKPDVLAHGAVKA